MKPIEITDTSSEELLADFKHEHIRFQFYHFQGGPRPRLTAGESRWTPAVDCYDTAEWLLVEVELAGVVSDEVQVRFGTQVLQISGQRRESSELSPRYYHVMEIERGKFERIIELPFAIDHKKAEAVFSEGMLILRLPKAIGGPFTCCGSVGNIKDFDE